MYVLTTPPSSEASMKILTPWWDVLLKYLTRGIITIALAITALQASRDDLVCSPAVDCSLPILKLSQTASQKDICSKIIFRLDNNTQTVITTLVDYVTYTAVDNLCFQESLSSQWYPAYFPFILVAEALLLLLIDNFWIMYPRTSTALNDFITLTMRCYACVGTHLDFFRVLSRPQKDERQTQVSVKEKYVVETLVEFISETVPLLQPEPITPLEQRRTLDVVEEELLEYHFVMSDAIMVKTLFEKVALFDQRFGSHTVLTKVYRARAVLQILFCIFILVFHLTSLSLINDVVICRLKEDVFVADYGYFVCARFFAPFYRAVTFIFITALSVYFVTIVYAFVWSIRNSHRYNVSTDIKLAFKDRVYLKGDLAFLFSLLEQYNKLYCDRLAVFLSEGLKVRLEKKIDKERNKNAKNRYTSLRQRAKTSIIM